MVKKKTEKQVETPETEVVTQGAAENQTEPTSFEQAALDEIKMLQKELVETQTKANEYLDGWQRSRAEFANYKKRIERDQSESQQQAAGRIARRYLEIVDDLDLALKNRPQDGDGAVWANGVELIYRKLLNVLDSEGVKLMKVLGEPFDPNFHEAISLEPSDAVPSGHVFEVLKQGYLMGDKVLRPALVRVAQ